MGNLTSTATDTRHPPTWDSAAQDGDRRGLTSLVSELCPSASRPRPLSAPPDEPEQHSFPYTNDILNGGRGGEGEGGGKGCVADGVQVIKKKQTKKNLDKQKNGALHLRESGDWGKKATAPSESLTAL